VRTGVSVGTRVTGYTGTGHITNASFDAAGDKVAIKISIPSAGVHTLSVRYSIPSGFGTKNNFVQVNAGKVTSYAFANTSGTWASKTIGTFNFTAGDNTITISKDWGWMDIDSISAFDP